MKMVTGLKQIVITFLTPVLERLWGHSNKNGVSPMKHELSKCQKSMRVYPLRSKLWHPANTSVIFSISHPFNDIFELFSLLVHLAFLLYH